MTTGRPLTPDEIAMLRPIFGEGIAYARVRIRGWRWFWPLPNNRSMAPNGHAYMPGADYAPDYAAPGVPLWQKGLFVHEATHLYQWYGLGWTVWLRGPFDRNYRYWLEPGRPLHRYGLEQMAMIAQHWFLLSHGARPRDLPDPSYTADSYADLLPVR